MDAHTRAYLKELANVVRANKKAVDAAEEICTCVDCIESRLRKQVSRCDAAKMIGKMYDEVLGSMPGNYVPELSPDYDLFKSGKRRAF